MSTFRMRRGPAALTALLLLSTVATAQATLDVPGTYPTINAAIQAASPGDTILVQPGLYAEFNLNFLGKDLHLVSALGAEVTVIDAGQADRVFVFNSGESGAARVDGFTIQNGRAADGTAGALDQPGGPGQNGGAMLIAYSSPTIQNCIFRWNAAGLGGNGGPGSPGQDGDTGSPNGTPGKSGGIGGPGGSGGAIFVDTGAPLIEACRFLSNVGGNAGDGGTGGRGGDGSSLWYKPGSGGDGGPGGAAGRGGDGGAIGTTDSTILIRCSLFHDNHSGQPGSPGSGGLGGYGYYGHSDGSPGSSGPANTSGWGGAMSLLGLSDEVNGCTVLDGSAQSGAGIYLTSGAVYNSVLWGNTPDQLVTSASVSHCDIEGGFSGAGNINLNPQFIDPSSADWHLGGSSPCINAGDLLLGTLAALDLDGLPRVIGLQTDMGAFEFPALYPGTLEDFILTTLVNGAGNSSSPQKIGTAGDQLTVAFESPGLTFAWAKPLFAMQGYTTGSVLPPTPGLPGIQINGAYPGLVLLDWGGGPLGPVLLPPGGIKLGLVVPPGLVGTTVRLQAFVISPWAANGVYAATNAHELEIQ